MSFVQPPLRDLHALPEADNVGMASAPSCRTGSRGPGNRHKWLLQKVQSAQTELEIERDPVAAGPKEAHLLS